VDPFLVAVTLYVFPGQEDAFERYERLALERVRGHRGKLVARMRCSAEARGDEAPYEFHLLSFPSEVAFDAFLASGVAHESERQTIISKTLVLRGAALTPPMDR